MLPWTFTCGLLDASSGLLQCAMADIVTVPCLSPFVESFSVLRMIPCLNLMWEVLTHPGEWGHPDGGQPEAGVANCNARQGVQPLYREGVSAAAVARVFGIIYNVWPARYLLSIADPTESQDRNQPQEG